MLEDEIRSDPSAKCPTTVLKLKLLTAHFSQYFTSRIEEASVFLRIVLLEMTTRQLTLSTDINLFIVLILFPEV